MVENPLPVKVHYRPMTLDDVEEVHQLDLLSFSLPWPERSYRYEVTQNPNAVTLVAEANGAEGRPVIAGMVVTWLIVDEVHIGTIAVHPDFRRQGIGRQLVVRILLACIPMGAKTAFLEVRRGNLAAQALYQQLGFTVVGERRRYYHDNNEDALLMTLNHIDPIALRSLVK